MPYFFLAFMEATGKDEDLSWRLTYLIPLLCHILSMILSWSSQDLPDGNYGQLENSGVKQKSKGIPAHPSEPNSFPKVTGQFRRYPLPAVTAQLSETILCPK